MLNSSRIRNQAYDINQINIHKNNWLFNQVVIPEYAESILGNTFV